jgi:phosphomannomutase
MINFLFDVDGTLTPSRRPMDEGFLWFFYKWVLFQQSIGNKVFFVTGSDKDKTIEQVGENLWLKIDGSYQSCGNQLYVSGNLIKQSNWMMDANLHLDVIDLIRDSIWYGKSSNNIEERVGMVNISTVGRRASTELRKQYYEWDKENKERESIVSKLSYMYRDLEFSIGGDISIDIYPKGKDKSQVLHDMKEKNIFFGDRCSKGGGDYEISRMSNKSYCVESPEDTYNILNKYFNFHLTNSNHMV